ncbi:MAG: hypothetical protein COZ18_06525 [Flexibacter sp. CG_4_10_14_3_um_filter_32_15]|nr:MAG: hypothetical protein COZ18_06525 [Flexibacter sp. CG_4_10_14_3_um_filter_32_15]
MKATVNGIQMESHFLLTLSSANSRYEDNDGTWQEPPVFVNNYMPHDTVCGDGWCDQSEFFFCEADCGTQPIPTDIQPVDDCPDITDVDVVIPSQDCGSVVFGRGSGRSGCTVRIGRDIIAAAK